MKVVSLYPVLNPWLVAVLQAEDGAGRDMAGPVASTSPGPESTEGSACCCSGAGQQDGMEDEKLHGNE